MNTSAMLKEYGLILKFSAVIFATAFTMAIIFTPPFIRIARKRGITDKPGARRVNVKVTPRLGGPAMLVGFLGGILITLLPFAPHIERLPAVLAGALIMFTVGLIDDIKSAKAGLKLIGQIGAAAITFALGLRIEFITNPFHLTSMIHLPLWISFLLTVFWIVGITNAINLIDGLDGLAAGIVCIASITFFLVGIQREQYAAALLAAALAGATGGFLRWNFYQAKTFMGDAGAYFLGYTVGVIAIMGAFKGTTAVTLLIPVFALGVPIFDTSFAIFRRAHSRMPIMTAADKGHLHHRMLAAGWRHRDSVVVCYLITLTLSSVSLALIREFDLALFLMLTVVALTLLLIAVGKLRRKNKGGNLHP